MQKATPDKLRSKQLSQLVVRGLHVGLRRAAHGCFSFDPMSTQKYQIVWKTLNPRLTKLQQVTQIFEPHFILHSPRVQIQIMLQHLIQTKSHWRTN